MDINQYQELSVRTMNNKLTANEKVDNMVYGITGEWGEVVDLLKKHKFQGHELIKHKLTEEIGDVMFYIANLCTLYSIDMRDVLHINYNKLLKRYPDGFSENKSVNREDI